MLIKGSMHDRVSERSLECKSIYCRGDAKLVGIIRVDASSDTRDSTKRPDQTGYMHIHSV